MTEINEEILSDLIIDNEVNFFDRLSVPEDQLNWIKAAYLDFIYLKSFETAELEIGDIFVSLAINLIAKLTGELDEIYRFNEDQPPTQYQQICRYLCLEVFYLINIVSFSSKKFVDKFHELKGIRLLIGCLNNEKLVDNYIKFHAEENAENLSICDKILRPNVGTLVCLAKSFGNYKNEWKECNAVKSLIDYFNKTKSIYDNRIYACMAIALVSDDDEIDSIPEIYLCLPEITSMIGDCAKAISGCDEAKVLQRTEIEIEDEEEVDGAGGEVLVTESCYVTVRDTEWALINLLDALYHLTVNDKIKKDIYNTFEVGEWLRMIIYDGNTTEQEYALNALWQLCFNIEIAEHVFGDQKLYPFIQGLTESASKKVSKNAAGIIWLLKKKLAPAGTGMSSPLPGDTTEFFKSTVEKFIIPANLTQHIMISYNRASRDLCLQIKAELEKLKFKVWIDVEDISGSSLESMANAIENSFCILVCMTEKYKQSPNCRAEGEYSFQLNKPIIPLFMQKDWFPDGWLGIILGSKIYINFTHNFEESMGQLSHELDKVLDKDSATKLKTLKTTTSETESLAMSSKIQLFSQEMHKRYKLNSKILNWSEKEVETWLREKNVHPIIVENLNSFNGRVLSELFLMKQQTPTFFYQSISTGASCSDDNKDLMLKDLALFTHELKTLFAFE